MAELTKEQQQAYDDALAGKSMFLTGNAGTGKSFVLRKIIKGLTEKNYEEPFITASTGIAAVNVGGVTIHSLLGIRPNMDLLHEAMPQVPLDPYHQKKAIELFGYDHRVIIIDEISMLDAPFFAYFMKMIKYGEQQFHQHQVQIILVGDFSQLPPVVTDKHLVAVMREQYGGIHAFDADAWNNARFPVHMLTKVIRQDDPQFTTALNQIRVGNPQGLVYINQQRAQTKIPDAITLVGTNKKASRINETELKRLNGVEFKFKSMKSGQFKDKQQPTETTLTLKVGCRIICLTNEGLSYNGEMGVITKISTNQRIYDQLGEMVSDRTLMTDPKLKSLNADYQISYHLGQKRDASLKNLQIVLRKLILRKQTVNNVTSIISTPPENLTDPEDDQIVSVTYRSDRDGVEKTLTYYKWDVYEYIKSSQPVLDANGIQKKDKNGKLQTKTQYRKHSIGSFIQMPIRLAYAITIHKSQGQTFQKVNLEPNFFDSGHAYVALSRVTDVHQLYLSRLLRANDVKYDPDVNYFYRQLLGNELPVNEIKKDKAKEDKPNLAPAMTNEQALTVRADRAKMLSWLNDLNDQEFVAISAMLKAAILFKRN